LLNNIAVAYAVTYLVGTTAAVWFLSKLAPRILNVDLKAESLLLGAKGTDGSGDMETLSGYREWDIRAYRLADEWVGQNVAALERSFARGTGVKAGRVVLGFIHECGAQAGVCRKEI